MIKEEKKITKNSLIDWIQLFLISLTAPFFLFPSMRYIWVLLVIPGIWIWRWIAKKHFFERTVLDWAIFILFIHVFAACLTVPDLGYSLPKITGILFGIIFFYSIIALLKSKNLIKLGIVSFLVAGLILSTIGILGMRWTGEVYISKIVSKIESIIPKIEWNIPGAEGGINPTALGGVLTLIVPLCLVLFVSHLKRKKENHLIPKRLFSLVFFSLILCVIMSVLFLSLSIGSWIALILSIWLLLLSWKWKKWSLVAMLIFIAFMLLITDKTSSVINALRNDMGIRESLWIVGTKTISQHPWLGIGPNYVRQIPSVRYERSHVHNHFLHTAAELGIPSLIAYLAILIGMGYMCFVNWRKSNIGWMRIAALGLACGQLAHLIFGMGDSIPLGAKPGIFFWFSLSLITAIYNYVRNNES